MLIAMEESSNYECSESHQSGGFFAVTKERRALMYAKLDKLREDLKKAVAKREAADAKVKQPVRNTASTVSTRNLENFFIMSLS